MTDEVEALAAAQPERRREYVRLERGVFHGALSERSDSRLSLGRERWGAALRVRCARPRDYVVFSAVASDAPASWCGVPLERGGVIELQHDWEITTGGPLEACSFAVERGSLERAEALLHAGERPPQHDVNRLLSGAAASTEQLRERVARALATQDLPPPARYTLVGEFLHLAATLRRSAGPAVRPESATRRRAIVRRVEEYLDAHERELPSLADLCAVAGASERTLEYAFREQLGVSPVRYLRVRRLNAVRRELRAAEPGAARVTDVAMRWGFWQLGRFAVEYRALFGERPSETARQRYSTCPRP